MLKASFLFAIFCTMACAQRGLPSVTDATSYVATQEVHVALLRERIVQGNLRFITDREMKLSSAKDSSTSTVKAAVQSNGQVSVANPEPMSDVLVSFSFRLAVAPVIQYVKGLDASAIALHRSVGDDQLSIGVPTDFDAPQAEAQLRRDFLSYLDEREANMLSEITRTEPDSFGRVRAEANLRAVVVARELTISIGMSFDGVLLRLPDRKLLVVDQLPDGSKTLLTEIQAGTRRSFAIPLDVLRASKNALK